MAVLVPRSMEAQDRKEFVRWGFWNEGFASCPRIRLLKSTLRTIEPGQTRGRCEGTYSKCLTYSLAEGSSMYCDGCGATVSAGARFCSACGKALVGGTAGTAVGAAPVAIDNRVRRHIQPLAILWLVNGILRLGEVAWLMIFGSLFLPGGRGWFGPDVRLPFGWSLESLMWRGLYATGITLALFGAVHLLLAWGLFERERWARILGIVVGVLALLRFPLGTALGIYTLWVLLPESSGKEYERLSQGSEQMNAARASS